MRHLAQGSFRLRSNLNLQFGARWEYQGVFDVRNGLMLRPTEGEAGLFGPAGVDNFFSPRSTPALTDTLMDFSGGRNGQPIYGRDLNDFSPFFGFSWSPGNDGKTAVRGAYSVHYTQDGFTLLQPLAANNTGLFTVATNRVATGVFSTSSNPTPAVPTASFPISQRQNFDTVSTDSDVWLFRPNLRTPYVQEWNLSFQRELWNRLTIEARYVGNHAVKLFRSWNINELNLANNGLVDDFKNAQNNLAIAGNNFSNQGRPGQTPLPIFERLFAGVPADSGFASSQFITWLNQNQIGNMFDTIRRTSTYQANREANFPLNFFVPDPFADEAIMVDNSSWSTYHGGQLEVARRFSSGLFFQGNYTLGKALTDTRFLSSNQEFQRFRKINDRSLDKNRAAFDVRHSFSSNFVYPLPFGTGRWLWTDAGPILNKLIGGWNVQGLNPLVERFSFLDHLKPPHNWFPGPGCRHPL